MRRTPWKSEGRGYDDEEASLLEKVLATTERESNSKTMRISSGARTWMRKTAARAPVLG